MILYVLFKFLCPKFMIKMSGFLNYIDDLYICSII